MPELRAASLLDAPPAAVWARVSTMEGVNAELAPWVRMTAPRQARRASLAAAPRGQVAFHSVLLALGVVPFDVHALRLLEVTEGAGFVEESSSWLPRVWRHERTLTPMPGGRCKVEDVVRVEPRIEPFGPVAVWLARRVFAARHRALRRHFGGEPA